VKKRARRRQGRQGKRVAKAIKVTPELKASGEKPQAPALLQEAANALNNLERAGIQVKLAHGAVLTSYGYVLHLGDDAAGWEPRSLRLIEFSPSPRDDGLWS
jgi:hypothetical protein